MKKTLFILSVSLFGFIGQHAAAQIQNPDNSLHRPAPVISLDEAIQLALANNPQIKRSLLAIKDANQLVRLAYSEVLPEITSSASYTRNIEVPVTFLPAQIFDPTAPPGTLAPVEFGTDNNWFGGLTVEQTIFRGEAIIGINSSAVFKTVQSEVSRSTSQQIVTNTRIAYYSVLIAKEELKLQQAQIKRFRENLDENKTRLRAGLVEEYDVLRLEVQLGNQEPELIQAEFAIKEALRNLNEVLGLPPDFTFDVTGDLGTYDITSTEAGTKENESLKKIDLLNPLSLQANSVILEDVSAQRGDLRVLQAQLNLKDQEITAIKSRFLPTLNAVYNVNWTAAEPGKLNPFRNPEPNTAAPRAQTLALSVSMPIFQGFKRTADVQRAKIERKDIEWQTYEATLAARNQIETEREQLNLSFQTADARLRALSQSRRGYDIALARFQNGMGSQLEVTEAESQVREAELNYASMVFNYLVAKARFDLATGYVPYIDTHHQDPN